MLEHVAAAGHLGPRYAFMTVMSCGIAILGLLQDSAAVIIGAMLISPLMGPIIELGMGLATFDFRTMRESLRTLVVGVALALGIAILIVWLSPLQGRHRRNPRRAREPTLRPAGRGVLRPRRRLRDDHAQGESDRGRGHRDCADAAAGGGRLRHRGGQTGTSPAARSSCS